MILLLLLLAFLGVNALAAWGGADSRDGRDWTPANRVRPGSGLDYCSLTNPSHDHSGMATPSGTRPSRILETGRCCAAARVTNAGTPRANP